LEGGVRGSPFCYGQFRCHEACHLPCGFHLYIISVSLSLNRKPPPSILIQNPLPGAPFPFIEYSSLSFAFVHPPSNLGLDCPSLIIPVNGWFQLFIHPHTSLRLPWGGGAGPVDLVKCIFLCLALPESRRGHTQIFTFRVTNRSHHSACSAFVTCIWVNCGAFCSSPICSGS